MKEFEIFQEDNISINDKYLENNDINFLDISFEKEMGLDDFLSKKFEGLLENDVLTDNGDEKVNESIGNLSDKKGKENSINKKGFEELLDIYRRVWKDKKSPFKRFVKPKKLSLNGRILDNFFFN